MSPPVTHRTGLSWFFKGAWDVIGFNAIMISVTMGGIGGLASEVGFPFWAAVLSTLVMWAGPSQIILFGSVAAGVALPAVSLAILVSAMRFLPMTVSILPLVRGERARWWQLLLASHLVSMSTWVEGLRRLPPLVAAARMPYFLGFGLMTLGVASLATGAGYLLYAAVPPPLAAVLLFMSPVYFGASILRSAENAADWTAIAFGALVAPAAFTVLPAGLDFLAVGLAGGTIAYLVRRRFKLGEGAFVMIAALQQSAGPLWPYVIVLVFGALPNGVWRMLGLFVSRGLDDESELLHWVRLVATTLLVAVVAKLVLYASGPLALVPLWARLGLWLAR